MYSIFRSSYLLLLLISFCYIVKIILFVIISFHFLFVSFPICFSEIFMFSSFKSFFISEFSSSYLDLDVSVLCNPFLLVDGLPFSSSF